MWAVILIAATTVLLTAHWYVGCNDSHGNHLGGIDCLQFQALPTTDAQPAASIGFLPLIIVAALALVIVVGIPLSTAIRLRRESVEY